MVGRPAPTSIIRSAWQQHVISALLVSPAVNILTTAMSANSLYAEIFKILSGGPISSLPRLLLLLCVQFWFALDTSLASPNPFLFPRLESGFWVFCQIPSFKLSLFHKIRESSLPPFVTPFSSAEQCLQARASHFVVLGYKADHDIVLFPSPHHVFSTRPLPWDLYAFRITISLPSVLSLDSAT